ncbi:MAG: exodeoxyribonuclease VII small subunit [Actinobacteria bacterium]|nr:exodeoxyribonuclease VII small subunit [Actinomycetota bacterium]
MATKKTDPSSIGYAEAVAELEEILDELESEEVDVDRLAAQVKRAADLIELCRGRLGEARTEITRIVADLELLDGDETP